jgi:histidinol-phosphatase
MATTFGPDWSAGLRRTDSARLEEWLAFANECADAADAIALDAFQSELQVRAKPDGSYVTQADTAIEEVIRTRLAERFPGHGIVGEELGTASGTSSTRWYIDPIDGTHNFMRRVPLFGSLIAVEHDGEVQAGVVSAPALGQRWWAHRGGGAWTSGGATGSAPRRLRVSHEGDLAASQVLFRSVGDMHASRVSEGFDALLPTVWRERGFGDFWGYMLVSDGAAEAMMEQDLFPWDLAAPWIIVEEAGGRITDFDGERSFARGESLAKNGLIHEAVLDRLWRRASTAGEARPT